MRILFTLLFTGTLSLLSAQPAFFLTGKFGLSWLPKVTSTAAQSNQLNRLPDGPPLAFSFGAGISFTGLGAGIWKDMRSHASLSFGRANVRDFTTAYSRSIRVGDDIEIVVAQASLQSFSFLDLHLSSTIKIPWLKGIGLTTGYGLRYITRFQTHLAVAEIAPGFSDITAPDEAYEITSGFLRPRATGTGLTLQDNLLKRFIPYASFGLETPEKQGRVFSFSCESTLLTLTKEEVYGDDFEVSADGWITIRFGVQGQIF